MRWEGERGGPGLLAAELVKEQLNVHLPSPEMLIKEEPGPSASAPPHPTDTHTHTHHSASLLTKTGFSLSSGEVLIERPAFCGSVKTI